MEFKHKRVSCVGCFNCGIQGCIVEACAPPRDNSRIEKKFRRRRELYKLNNAAKINIDTVPTAWSDSSEAKEVMIASILVNQYDDTINSADNETEESADTLINLDETL